MNEAMRDHVAEVVALFEAMVQVQVTGDEFSLDDARDELKRSLCGLLESVVRHAAE